MSEETTTNPEPEEEPVGGTAVVAVAPPPSDKPVRTGSTAEQYIADELVKARQALKVSQITSVLIVVILGGIIWYITSGFTGSLEPHAAAEIATGLISTQVSDRGPELVTQVRDKVTELIEQTPDYVRKELPQYREQLEQRIEDELTKYSQASSDQLNAHLDTFLDAHKENVKALMETSKDEAAVHALGADLKVELLKYIDEKPASGESIRYQLDESLKALQEIRAKVKRLAANKALTPQEVKARRAIAVLANAIEKQRSELTSNIQ